MLVPLRLAMTVLLLVAAPIGATLSAPPDVGTATVADTDRSAAELLATPTTTPTTPTTATAVSDAAARDRAPPRTTPTPHAPARSADVASRAGGNGPRATQQDTRESTRVPPRPGTEANGLTVNESAALWSRDPDDFITNAQYREAYGESRTPMQELANGTDITFARPPATAAIWSRNDFADLEAGDDDTSVYPTDANLTDGLVIKDAHATIFGVWPSTRGHLAPAETPLYIAPEGTLRGFIDYRTVVPNVTTRGNTTITWRVLDYEIEEVRLKQDDEVIARMDGTHRPVIDYRATDDWSTTLTLEADIRVDLKRIEHIPMQSCPAGNTTASCGLAVGDPAESAGEPAAERANATAESAGEAAADTASERGAGTAVEVNVTRPNETVTVSDSVAVEVYNLTAHPHYATYPDGDAGVAIFQRRPWQGYTLGTDEADRVRGVWRFYTARDVRWDTLTRSTATGTTTVLSDAHPVYVHAYPSEIGPRPPAVDGPELLDVWGVETGAPADTVGPAVYVDTVEQPYTRSYGMAVRDEAVDRDALTVHGIVRSTTATLVSPSNGATRQLHASNLTVTVLNQTRSHATLRLELRDAKTGAPIALAAAGRGTPILDDTERRGYIALADRRVRTNRSGVAIIRVDEPGAYTARYRPASWLAVEPAYTGDTASVRWHPLTTLAGWWGLLVASLWFLLPFAVAWYAGRRLMLMFPPDTHSHK